MYEIVSKKNLTGELHEFKIRAPHITNRGQAGQFIILRVEKTGERVPLTIADVDKENGLLTIVFMAVGDSTKKLAAFNEGDSLPDIVGPLGIPTETQNKYGTVVVVAGGYGAAPAYLIAKAYKESGNRVYMIVGSRTKELLFWLDKMEEACDELFITTDDGSHGSKGLVTQKLDDLVNREPIHHVMAIGPIPMMKAVADQTRDHSIYTVVSLNPIMVDGTGMCGACRVTVGGETKFACVDGPDFDGHKVDFEELINRNKIYKEHPKKKRSDACNMVKQSKELEAQK